MIVIARYRVTAETADVFATGARAALTAFAACPGYRRGTLGRAADDPDLWVMVTEWDGAGFYRRALSSFDVRLAMMSLAAQAIDEPSAYEIVDPPE